MNIDGNTFLVTGGASGLGEASARMIVARGGQVVIADLNEEAGNALAQELGASAQFAATDVTDTASVQNALDMAAKSFGPLRGVINCAGVLHAARVVGRSGPYPLEEFNRVIQINLVGTFNVIRLAGEAISKTEPCNEDGERGVILNTASVAAFDGQVGQASYSASKGAIVSMMLPIAREFAKFGVRVAAIAPGIFETPMMGSMPPDARAALEEQVPFPSRLGKPAEFADMAAHMIENEMINGTTIRLDGALRMGK